MIRQIIFLAVFPVLTAVASLLCLAAAPIGKNCWLSYKLESYWAMISLWLAGVEVEHDLHRLTPGQTYVFMANHQSQFDILVLFSVLTKYNMRFVAKESLFRIPVFGWAMLYTGHIPILRENSRKAMKSIDDAVKAAEKGLCMLIFPEGTRNPNPETVSDFKIGGMVMALKCRRPVAPIIITGSGGLLPKGSIRPRPGKVKVTALAPFDPSLRYTIKRREDFKTWLHDRMSRAYQELR